MIAYAAVFTLLAEFRGSFGFSETALGLIAGSSFIAGFIAQLGLARFADSGQGALLMKVGIVMAFIGTVWMCFAESLAAWLMARMLLGFGAGCVRPGMRRLAFVLNPNRAGEMIGRLAAWEMVGFLIGPIVASGLFELFGIRAPFIAISLTLVCLVPFVFRVDIPGSKAPMQRAMLTLIRRPAMQSSIALGVAFYMAVGVFDAIWAVFMADRGASQLFIGITMSLFTLPMIFVAPFAGTFAAKRHLLRLLTVTLSLALLAMISYGFIDSYYWMCLPLLIHALADAISMPAMQLAVGKASGETALAAGQGLYGAISLLVAAGASIGAGAVYQSHGAAGLWISVAGVMTVCIAFANFRGRKAAWT
jgi:MFS family permease